MNNFSIIIPAFNESKNLSILLDEIILNCLNNYNYQIIIVDDKSEDNTQNIIKKRKEKNIKLISNKYNQGQSYSIHRGIQEADYENIITIDADLQNDPKDIPKIAEIYFYNKNIKLVAGIRTNRKDNMIKIVSSKIANFVRSLILKDNCPDTGCSLKIFDKSFFLNIPFFDGMHRFIPAFFIGMNCKVIYEPVNHRYRKYGKSNYSTLSRLFKGLGDLYRVSKMIKKIKNND